MQTYLTFAMVFAGQSVYRMYPRKPLNPVYLVPAIVSAFALPVMLVKVISVGRQHSQKDYVFPVSSAKESQSMIITVSIVPST